MEAILALNVGTLHHCAGKANGAFWEEFFFSPAGRDHPSVSHFLFFPWIMGWYLKQGIVLGWQKDTQHGSSLERQKDHLSLW